MPTRKTPSPKPSVDINAFLIAEFEYIVQTASEAHEDRARVSSFYLVAVGSLIAALFGTEFFKEGKLIPPVAIILSILFFILTYFGTSTIKQLARLRAAWHDSMLAMNKIKDFATEHKPELVDAFHWKTSSLPDKFKKNSISYYQAIEVSLISGLMLGMAAFFVILAIRPDVENLHVAVAGLAGFAMFRYQLSLYTKLLKAKEPNAA